MTKPSKNWSNAETKQLGRPRTDHRVRLPTSLTKRSSKDTGVPSWRKVWVPRRQVRRGLWGDWVLVMFFTLIWVACNGFWLAILSKYCCIFLVDGNHVMMIQFNVLLSFCLFWFSFMFSNTMRHFYIVLGYTIMVQKGSNNMFAISVCYGRLCSFSTVFS